MACEQAGNYLIWGSVSGGPLTTQMDATFSSISSISNTRDIFVFFSLFSHSLTDSELGQEGGMLFMGAL